MMLLKKSYFSENINANFYIFIEYIDKKILNQQHHE